MGPEQVLDHLATTDSVQVVIAVGFVMAVCVVGVLWRALRTKDREMAEATEKNAQTFMRLIEGTTKVHATVEVLLARAASELDALDARQIRDMINAQSRQLSAIHETLSELKARTPSRV